jgi:hypothetical protein
VRGDSVEDDRDTPLGHARRVFTASRPTTTPLLDVLPSRLWQNGVTGAGGRLHFCIAVTAGGTGHAVRTLEWKSYNVAFGRRPYSGAHVERQPGRYDDPDSYE